MRLPAPFIKLPLRFDVARLKAEVDRIPESEWRAHPQGFAGNSALVLVSHRGGENDDTHGAMAPAPRLAQCDYLRQVMASFQTVLGRSRLMRLEPGAEVTPHTDIDFYWRDRIRIHVPIVTDPSVRFNCDGVEIHMGEGEAWIFDNWRPHYVVNRSGIRRVHLVMDTVGSAAFWQLASTGAVTSAAAQLPTQPVEYREGADAPLLFESHAPEPLAHPAAVKGTMHELVGDLRSAPARTAQHAGLENAMLDFANEWQALWARFGGEPRHHAHYAVLIEDTLKRAGQLGAGLRLPSNSTQVNVVLQKFLSGMFEGFQAWLAAAPVPAFTRPVIVVAAPRSGSTLLFETLARIPGLWNLGDESHAEIESIAALSPRNRGFASNSLTGEDATPDNRDGVLRNFTLQLRDHQGRRWLTLDEPPPGVRLLEKTPKNALRIPFLKELFPDAVFLFIHRSAAENLGSMLDAWQSGRFVTYPDLPDWPGPPWSLLLPHGWRELRGRPPADVVAAQWRAANQAIVDELSKLPRERWRVLDYAELVRDPAGVVQRAAAFIGLPPPAELQRSLAGGLPPSRYTLSAPMPDKWRRHEQALKPVLEGLGALQSQLCSLDNRL
ncbi:MAG TPA: sulfotransferase [Gammaproteobacteria bacterium]